VDYSLDDVTCLLPEPLRVERLFVSDFLLMRTVMRDEFYVTKSATSPIAKAKQISFKSTPASLTQRYLGLDFFFTTKKNKADARQSVATPLLQHLLKMLSNSSTILFSDNYMGPRSLCFFQDVLTEELIFLCFQSKLSVQTNLLTRRKWGFCDGILSISTLKMLRGLCV